jgi:hypothetical protein
LTKTEQANIMKHAGKLLKNDGYFILTIDLFLDLCPFSDKSANELGSNVNVAELIQNSRFELFLGDKRELNGFKEFDPQKILAKLNTLFLGTNYPVVPQLLALRKTPLSVMT